MLIKIVVILKHHELHLHSLRDADLLVHQRTFCLYIIVHRCPQRVECLCVTDIFQIKHKILAPADLRIHPDPEAVYEIAPVKLVPQHSIVIICRIFHHKRREFLSVDHLVRLDVPFSGYHIPNDAVKIGNHHITAMFLCRPDHKLCRIRRQPVITVHKLEIRSLCPFYSLISRIRHPGIFFVDHHHTLIRLRIRITDRA